MVLIAAVAALALMVGSLQAETLRVEEATAVYAATMDFSPETARLRPLDSALRADAARALDDFKAEAAGNPDPARPHTFALEDTARFASDRYLSVLRTVDVFAGGAHGLRSVRTLTWDEEAGALIGMDALVTPAGMEAVSQALRAAIAREVHGGEVSAPWRDSIVQATLARAETLRNFTLAPVDGPAHDRAAGLDFHFAPYDVAPYVAGAPVVHVPATVFSDHLTPQGAALFHAASPQQ